jgi:CubicO group peptidase (beta-lactamase class C family)
LESAHGMHGKKRELANQTLFFQPGKEWRYGPSVDIQGYLVEKFSGQGLDQFFEQRIFRPLGMTDTSFWVHPSKVSRLSRMHRYGIGGNMSQPLSLARSRLRGQCSSPVQED